MYPVTRILIPGIFIFLALGWMSCKKDKSSATTPVTTPSTVSIPFSPICQPPDSATYVSYRDDAVKLALSYLYDHHFPDTGYMVVDPILCDALINALAAIKSSHSLQRDSVINRYNIHAVCSADELRNVLIEGDSTAAWFQKLSSGNLNTGNTTFDSLAHYCEFSFVSSYSFPWGKDVSLRSGTALNLNAVCKALGRIPGVHYAEPNVHCTDGERITLSNWNTSYIELLYSHGWDDCPSGCIARRYWKFRVHTDCTAEFVESYGSPNAP